MAQPSDQPPTGPTAPTSSPDTAAPKPDTPPAETPPKPVTPPPVEQAPPAKPSVYAQCMEQRHRLSEEASHESDLQERTRLLQSMPECNPEMDQVPPSAAARGASSDDNAPTATGFALELHLETDQIQAGSSSFLPVMDTGVFFGHHSGKVTFGIGIDFARLTMSQSTTGGGAMDVSQSFNSLLIMPGIRATLARSSDQRTELIGALDIGYGAIWDSTSEPMGPDNPTISHFRAQIGPGLRYWVSRSFAVGGTGGIRYDRQSRDSSDGTSSTSLSNTNVFGSLALTGVF